MAGTPQMQRAGEAAVDGGAAAGHRTGVASGNGPVHLLALPAHRSSASPQVETWRGSLATFAIASAVLAWLFREEIAGAVQVWSSSATFGHAFFILPIVLFLFYRMRHDLARHQPEPAPWAILPIAVLALVWLVGEVAHVLVVKQLAFVGLWQALFLLVMGRHVTRAALFPLLYLYFAVPAGSSAIPALQEVTAQMVVSLLRLTGIPVFLDGYLIEIPSGRFLVAEACSGVRYLIVSIALAVLVAHLFLRSWPRRLLFIGLSVALPIVANGIRAYGIIMLAHFSDYRFATDVDHVFYGLVFLSFVTLALLVIAALLRKGEGRGEPYRTPSPGCTAERRKPAKEILATQAAWCGAALAAVFLVQIWVATAKQAPTVPAPMPLLAEAVAPWQSVPGRDPLWEPRFHSPDVVLRASYRLGPGQVDVHVAHYAYQREGAEAVSEMNDLAGADKTWRVMQLKPAAVTIADREHRFTRMLLTNRSDRYVVWSWYRVAGENASSRLLGKLLELKALMPGTEQAASVIAIGSRVSEDTEQTDALLGAFLKQILESNGSLVRLDTTRAAGPAAAP